MPACQVWSAAITKEKSGFDDVPVMRPQLPTADQLLPYLRRIDAARTYSNWGPLNAELEQRLCVRFSLPEGGVITASSGTSALVGAILATAGRASVRKPLAILPAYTFVGSAAALEQCGYQLFLADIDAETWLLDPQRLLAQIDPSVLKQTSVVMPVATFGRPVPQAPWREFRDKTRIPVVIDGAASFEGASENPTEFLGSIPVAISFHATKSFATGEGGCVVCGDAQLGGRVMRALNFGFYGTREAMAAGINGKLSEYHAAVGLAELNGAFELRRQMRRAVLEEYRRHFAAAGLAHRFTGASDLGSHYAIFLCADEDEATTVQDLLMAVGVDSRLWYGLGMHRHAHYRNALRESSLANMESIAPRLGVAAVA